MTKASSLIYCYPVLGRYGLGHSLPSWGRCVLWSKESGAQMLAPQWFQPRLGPYMRREKDKREYFRLFRSPGYVTGLRRLAILVGAKRLEDHPELPRQSWPVSSPVLVTFTNSLSDNQAKYMPQLRDHHAILYDEMRRITRPVYHPAPVSQPTIAIHVRLGDFDVPPTEEVLYSGANNIQIPVSWYAEMLQGVRRALDRDLTAVVFSDGDDERLAPLLSMPSVRRAPDQESITDMLAIADCDMLIASGSSFSIWGRFLGQTPSVCFPGQSKVRVLVDLAEIECKSPDDLSAQFIARVEQRLKTRWPALI